MENTKQVTLNGKPLWKAKHSDLTTYCKKNSIDLKPGLKTYQIASIVKKHLISAPEKTSDLKGSTSGAKESPKEASKVSQTKGKQARLSGKSLDDKIAKLKKNKASGDFDTGVKVSFTERGTKKDKKGEILKMNICRGVHYAFVKTSDKDQWVNVSKLTKV